MTFRLLIEGACVLPRSLSWAELDALALDDALVPDTAQLSHRVRGQGVRLAALLSLAQPTPDATHVMIHDDGESSQPSTSPSAQARLDYRACLTLAEAMQAAVLAHRLDGAPLPESSGGPVRLLVPTSDNACLSVKRVARVVLLPRAEPDTVPRPTTPLRR